MTELQCNSSSRTLPVCIETSALFYKQKYINLRAIFLVRNDQVTVTLWSWKIEAGL